MPLRCLLFSSDEAMVQPIWQILTELGIEGEYCRSAVDAVERVTTQLFQIVITDWEDQPEAAFLLKTARDQKAAHRPLTLAIVSDDARLPEALQAGANSVLLKPIRSEQVRDTMNTACELLRSKQPSAPQPAVGARPPEVREMVSAAAAAGKATPVLRRVPAAAARVPENVSEKTFRAGEFLQTPSSAPGAQFDTESDQNSFEQVAGSDVNALSELEPMASAVAAPAPTVATPLETPGRDKALSGWAALQARLTQPSAETATENTTADRLRFQGQGNSSELQTDFPNQSESAEIKARRETGAEAALFSYIEGESKKNEAAQPAAHSNRTKLLFMGGLLALAALLMVVPRSRQSLVFFYRNSARAGRNWLNPQPVPVAQTAPQHESFGQAGDEYKLPVVETIPDATTDPSQIRVLPVIDPTAKPKNADANAIPADTSPIDQNRTAPQDPANSQAGENPGKEQVATSAVSTIPTSGTAASTVQAQPNLAVTPGTFSPPAPPPSEGRTQSVPAPQMISPASSAGIPSSLRTQLASSTPEASGTKPVEAAMTSIEPVSLPESVTRGLLQQSVEPEYPDAAKTAGQRGSVVLELQIGRDGTVQGAKMVEGSLVFARPAIDAVKQWRFKPYTLNGRAVAVQSLITLNFKPPA